jgi:hypothetical protein
MKTKAVVLSISTLLFGGALATGVFAYQGNPNVTGPNYSAERHDQMLQIMENKDYDAWKELMENRGSQRVTQIITKDNFEKFAQVHTLMQEGKLEEAKALRQELGLGLRDGSGMGDHGQHKGNGSRKGLGR